MNAEIFYLDDDEALIAGLGEELRRQVYPGLEVQLRRLSSNQREVIDMGRRYVKLLQASIRPEKGFKLDLTALEQYGYRFYIYVYYAFAYAANKKFQESGLHVFFPAVAVRNRMALVPAGLGKELELSWNDQLASPFKPLGVGGAAEVDFHDSAAVQESLAQVAQAARADLLQEIRAYASYRSPGEIELPALARDMDVDVGFLQSLFTTGELERAFYRQLTCELAPTKLAPGRWTRVTLTVRNDSEVSLAGLTVRISGPVEVRPLPLRLDVGAGSVQTAPVSIKPVDRGEFPLEVVLALPDDQAFSAWLPVQHVWLECD
jgi:hypothetical protein